MSIRFHRLAVVLAAAALTLTVSPAQAVYRGHDANFHKYRFMVSLHLAQTPDRPRCTATLIEPDIVLTAAHCVEDVPQGGLVVTVGADIPDWPTAPRVSTLGHRIPPTFGGVETNRDDIAVVRLASPQSSPTVRLAAAEPAVGDRTVVTGFGCVSAPPTCDVRATTLQESRQIVLADADCAGDIFILPTMYDPSTICTKGVRFNSSVNRGDSGGPLLVRDHRGGFRQVGVTSLGSDSTDRIRAGFTSIPVEADWIAAAIESLRAG